MSTKDEGEKAPKGNISEKSGVQLSLVISLLTIAVAITAGWVTLSSKIDGVIAWQKEFKQIYTTDGANLHDRVGKLEQEVARILAAGSPKLSEVERHLSDLEQSFKVHVAETVNGKKMP